MTPERALAAADFYESSPDGQFDTEAAFALRMHHEMLAALRGMLEAYFDRTGGGTAVSRAEKVLAKAEGKS